MTGSARPGSRKRTKTFTGCWTCRARKVKCDETVPTCHQCDRKQLDCGGYGIRLQWLPPVVALPSGDILGLDETDPIPVVSSRRSLLPRCSQAVLPPHQVEGILRYLDAAEHSLLSSNDDISLCDHSFAVFASRPGPTATSDKDPPSSQISPLLPPGVPDAIDIDASSGLHYQRPDGNFLPDADVQDHYIIHSNDVSVDAYVSPVSTTRVPAILGHVSTTSPIGVPDGFGDALSVPDNWLDAAGSPSSGPAPGIDLDRFLMRHYAERVCHLFCVIDTAKSPWKTIHLPRALQSMGEMSVTGKTTTVRKSLCNALLSISAWYLSNDHHRHQNNDLGERWASVAAKYGYNAIAMLKQAVESDMYASPKPKYKEFLASMLSMITVNVMSGDTHTCGVHLDGAGQLIKFLWEKKQRLSEKTRALYSIYCYLRVIYESTLVQDPSEATHHDINPESVFCFFDQSDSSELTQPSLSAKAPTDSTAMFECIYGIPQRLLAMLEEVTKIIERLDYFRAANGSAPLPSDLETACDRLENDILDWTMKEDRPSLSSKAADAVTSASREIIRNQTRAFHGALVIFFSQNVRLLDHRYLRQDVENILQSIETIEHIKSETNMLAAPIFWPAFIAATEAFESKHQARFRKWHEEVTSYGIASVRTGIDVVNEVWKIGPSRGKRHTSLWRTVVASSGDSLMLS